MVAGSNICPTRLRCLAVRCRHPARRLAAGDHLLPRAGQGRAAGYRSAATAARLLAYWRAGAWRHLASLHAPAGLGTSRHGGGGSYGFGASRSPVAKEASSAKATSSTTSTWPPGRRRSQISTPPSAGPSRRDRPTRGGPPAGPGTLGSTRSRRGSGPDTRRRPVPAGTAMPPLAPPQSTLGRQGTRSAGRAGRRQVVPTFGKRRQADDTNRTDGAVRYGPPHAAKGPAACPSVFPWPSWSPNSAHG
jgi:hypothetical protein